MKHQKKVAFLRFWNSEFNCCVPLPSRIHSAITLLTLCRPFRCELGFKDPVTFVLGRTDFSLHLCAFVFLYPPLSLLPLLSRCMSLSDPAAIPDTPRGRGPQPPQKEKTAEQEEPLSLFDLPAAPQTVRGRPDRHPGQCRLRRPQLRDSSLTPFEPPSHWTIEPTPLSRPSSPPQKDKPDHGLLLLLVLSYSRVSQPSLSVFWGEQQHPPGLEHSAGAGRRSHPRPEQWLFFF